MFVKQGFSPAKDYDPPGTEIPGLNDRVLYLREGKLAVRMGFVRLRIAVYAAQVAYLAQLQFHGQETAFFSGLLNFGLRESRPPAVIHDKGKAPV
jgi:hypothetical protein